MVEVSDLQIEEFAKNEFPGQPFFIGKGFWYIQAGKYLGEYLHYEYHANQVHLHIEGHNWRGIRDYLWNHVMDTRVSHKHWWRYGCCWTLHTKPQTWDELKEAFRTIAYIMNPHILKFERSISTPIVEREELPVSADFIKIAECLKKQLCIPEYQRPYRWGTKNVDQLLKDIKNSQDNGKLTYLIGTVILHETEDSTFNIVDGQQRITTIILLLKQLEYSGDLPNLKYNHSDSFSNIQKNYEYIGHWLDYNIADKKRFLNYILNSCIFVEIIVKRLNEAFQMFESQNGRGKELEAYNLLKAYHIRAMSYSSQEDKILCDKRWEDATMHISKNNNRKDILYQLFKEQLYRPRVWVRGESAYKFGKKHVDEFKGVTLDKESSLDFAFQNILVQQEIANLFMRTMNTNLIKVKGRFIHGDSGNINPFVNITQLILNGKAFFEYVETYVEIYKRLFMQLESSQLIDFKRFYKDHCIYESYNWRKGDGYIREVYKSAIMMTFDRFGEMGVNDIYKELYMCIYRYRLEKKQIRYETMAKSSNTGWIFQTIQNAKSLSDLHLIKHKALIAQNNLDIKYQVDEILNVFKQN